MHINLPRNILQLKRLPWYIMITYSGGILKGVVAQRNRIPNYKAEKALKTRFLWKMLVSICFLNMITRDGFVQVPVQQNLAGMPYACRQKVCTHAMHNQKMCVDPPRLFYCCWCKYIHSRWDYLEMTNSSEVFIIYFSVHIFLLKTVIFDRIVF